MKPNFNWWLSGKYTDSIAHRTINTRVIMKDSIDNSLSSVGITVLTYSPYEQAPSLGSLYWPLICRTCWVSSHQAPPLCCHPGRLPCFSLPPYWPSLSQLINVLSGLQQQQLHPSFILIYFLVKTQALIASGFACQYKASEQKIPPSSLTKKHYRGNISRPARETNSVLGQV